VIKPNTFAAIKWLCASIDAEAGRTPISKKINLPANVFDRRFIFASSLSALYCYICLLALVDQIRPKMQSLQG
jgi:hypothetical protein